MTQSTGAEVPSRHRGGRELHQCRWWFRESNRQVPVIPGKSGILHMKRTVLLGHEDRLFSPERVCTYQASVGIALPALRWATSAYHLA